jgi:hypothetical protein
MDGVALGFLERGDELSEIVGPNKGASAGAGCVTTLLGPAGEGKSTLLGGATEWLTDAGFRVLCARGFEQEPTRGGGLAEVGAAMLVWAAAGGTDLDAWADSIGAAA